MAERAQWGSRLGFILAAAGSAVGLGNIWRFPYTTGENGGGAFVLIYLACVALIGVPIMMSEIMIGRAAQKQPVAAFHALQGRKTAWAGVGWLGVVAGFIILSYYIVVAGWAMDYTLKSIVNSSGSIADSARVESLAYSATTPLDDMRRTLIDHEAGRTRAALEKTIWMDVRPSSRTGYDDFRAALARAGADDAAAREKLLMDPVLRRQVEEAEVIQDRLRQAAEEAQAQAEADVAARSDAQVKRDAQDKVRRDRIREGVTSAFLAVAGDGWTSTFWTALFMLLTIAIVAGGISGGIEKACLYLMPALFALIIVLVIYGMFTPGFGRAVEFVIVPDLHEMRPSSFLEAMGQSFFSLSLGMGAMITYGSYQRAKTGLAGQSVTIAGLDTAVAILACFMIFPIVFSFGQETAAGPGLVFMAMPLAFAEIGAGGMLLGAMFFGLLVFAALTSSISLLEVVASYFIDEQGWSRRKATWVLGGIIFLLAVPSAFALDPDFVMSGWLGSYGANFDFLTTMDYLASNWMLPAGGFFIAIYAGWVMPGRMREAELEGLAPGLVIGWLLLARFVAPAAVVIVLLQKIGVLNVDDLLFGLLH